MHIIFGIERLKDIDSKYTVLELDTVFIKETNQKIPAYCLIESMPITDMANIEQHVDLHTNLIKNYRNRNWKFCQDALEHLIGKWNGEVDSFYNDLAKRISYYKTQNITDDWDWTISSTKNVDQ